MGRVFDALKREQKRKKKNRESEPLNEAAETTDHFPDEAPNDFQLPSLIGAPEGPRSNEGLILPGGAQKEIAFPHESKSHNLKTDAGGTAFSHSPGFARAHTGAAAAYAPLRQAQPFSAPPVASPNPPAVPGFIPPQTRTPENVPGIRLELGRQHARLVMLREPQHPGCEQYRKLRTQLFHLAERELTQVIVITSSVAGEGKTSTSLNLAIAIAQSREKRVLVVDGDLRRPSIAAFLGVKPPLGLREVLTGKATALAACVRMGQHSYLLPAQEVGNPSELLSSERLGAALKQLRESFDFIIVDSPPVLPFADARLLANHADGAVFVVRAGEAPYETVEQAIQALAPHRLLGVVLNGAEESTENGYYEDYYRYREPRPNLLWANVAPKVRDSWLGRKLKL